MVERFGCWLRLILYAGIGLELAGAFAVAFLGYNESVFVADAAVVPGNQVFPTGVPSPRLAARLEKALKLYNDGICPVIIVSGGIGKEGIDEAKAMASWLFQRGVPRSAVVIDSSGVNTAATARFASRWLGENNGSSIIVVSQFFHLPRTMLAIKKQGIPSIGAAYARLLRVAGHIFGVQGSTGADCLLFSRAYLNSMAEGYFIQYGLYLSQTLSKSSPSLHFCRRL